MANLDKVGQRLKSAAVGKVAEFGRGIEGSFVSGNPALFGPALNELKGLKNVFENQAKETKKDREERKRERQFDEENKNEQRKLDTDILKSLKAIEKMLGDFISKQKKGFFEQLREAFAPFIVLLIRAFSQLKPLILALVAGFVALNDNLSDFVKMFAGWTRQLGDAFGKLAIRLGSLFDDLFKNFRGGNLIERLTKGIGGWIDDVLKAARIGLSGIAFTFLQKFTSFFDDAVKTIKTLFAGSFFTKLAQIFDVELDFIKNFKMPEGWAKVKELFNAGITKIVSFFQDIANNPIFEKIGTALGKFGKALPIIGNIIMVIEGFFAAFDTEQISQILGKQMSDVNFGDRITAFLGGLVGSIFGIFDLIGNIIGAVFGLEEGEGETVQKKATRVATQFIDNIFKWVKGLGEFIVGLLTFDKKAMGQAMGDMSQAVVDSLGVLLSMIANTFIDAINWLIEKIPFISNDNKLKKMSTFTSRETQVATAQKSVSARPSGSSGASWDAQFGEMYDSSGKLKPEYAKQQEELLKRATAEGFYEALKRPGSLSISEALNISANIAEDEAINGKKRWEETQRYEQERAGYYSNFQATLKSGFSSMIDKLADMGSTEGGAGRQWGEKLVGKSFDKLGKKIFGKETGGEIGQIFTQLFGSYADQVVSQTLGPALFGGDTKQSNRFFNNLVSGNKKAAQEDLLYGMFGISTGMRSAIGYEEGAEQLAKDLAEVAGAPFAGLFGVDPNKQDPQEKLLTKTVSDPIVDAQFATAEMIVDELGGLSEQTKMLRAQEDYYRERYDRRTQRTGGGGALYGKGGKLIKGATRGGGYFGDTASGRIMDTGLRMGQASITQAIAGDNIFGQALVGSIVGDFTDAFMMNGEFNIASTFGNVLGIDIPPGMGIMEAVGSGYLFSQSATMAKEIGDQVAILVSKMGGNMNTAMNAGMIAERLGNAAIAYTISKTISGEYSAGGWVDAATAIAGAFVGPIAGVIGGLVNRAFGMGKKRITQQGITGTLGEQSSSLVQYADWHQKGGWFRSSRSGTNYYALDPAVTKDLTAGAKGISTGVRKIAQQMGLGRLDIPEIGTRRQAMISPIFETKSAYVSSGEDTYLEEYEALVGNMITIGGIQRALTDAERAVIGATPAGSVGRTDNFAFRVLTNEQKQVKNRWGRTLPSEMDNAVIEILDSANEAYAIAFEKMKESFAMQIRTSGYDMEKILEDYGEQFVKNSFGNLLNPFMQAGETLVEGFDRLSSAMVNFDGVMLKLNYTFQDLSFSLIEATDIFASAALKDTFIDLYGGMEKFMKQTQQFFELFYTQEEKLQYYERVGREQMQFALEEAGLEAQMTVDSLLGGAGDTMESARIAYRKIVDDFVEENANLLAANDPETIERLAVLHGDLAASYYTAVQAIQELDKITDSSREALELAVLRIFETESNQFALGGIATGPETGYGATLHGTEAVIPLPNGRSIPVMLQGEGTGGTIINNNIVGNGNASVSSAPTNVFAKTPEATSGTTANRLVSTAY